MSGLFLKLLNMSISASVLIVVVVLARCLLRKSPKWIHCILWALVGIRLLCPFQLETTFSLAPNAQVVSIEAGAVTSQVLAEMPALDNTANRYLAKYYFEGITVPEQETAQNPMNLIASIWLCGVAVLLVYAAVSYVHIRRKVRESVRIEGNIYICDRIQTPFIFGVLNPRIYLPSSLKEVQIKNVVAHEKAHIRRLDYLWKPLGYVLFAVYWFNPFCWLAYILFCRDIEMACDERVIKDWSAEQKKEYSLVLLSFHVPGKMITVCPLAFGEVGVKQRVKGILNFKKPTFWLIAAALLFCVIIGALFLTNPKKNDNVEENIATELSESSLTDQTLNTEKDSLADQESELNALLKKQSDAIRAQQQSFLQTWADAFCDRDGAAIDSLCMDGARKKMMKEQLLVIDEGDTIFGWSSPWPMWDTSDENSKGYTITTSYDGKNTAEILYYAWTSDPHVTVWKEDITFEERDGSYKVTDENIRFLDYIVSGTEFDEAYPQINGTPMDYTVNGMYDALVMNSLLSSSMLYQNLNRILKKDSDQRGLNRAIFNIYEKVAYLEYNRENPLFWLQFAIARLADGEYSDAARCFDNAYSYAKNTNFDTFQIDNHFARYLLEDANEKKNVIEPIEVFKRAHRMLMASQKGNQYKHYSFRVARHYSTFYSIYHKDFSFHERYDFFIACHEMLDAVEKYLALPGASKKDMVEETRKQLEELLINEN